MHEVWSFHSGKDPLWSPECNMKWNSAHIYMILYADDEDPLSEWDTHTINTIAKNTTKKKSMKICCNNIQIVRIISDNNPKTIRI
jgi:hypothetical protein